MPTHAPDDESRDRPASGVITSIQVQKKRSSRLSVFLDDAFGFGVHQDVLLEHGLHVGLKLDRQQVNAIIQADALVRAKETAVAYLGYRARTEFEVKKKLREKGFSEEIGRAVLQRLHELSLIDDARFTREFVQSRFNARGYGPQRLRADLLRAGIDASLIEETLKEWIEEVDLYEAAKKQAEKRWKRLTSEPEPAKKRQKLYGYLLRQGYPTDVVRDVVASIDASNRNGR